MIASRLKRHRKGQHKGGAASSGGHGMSGLIPMIDIFVILVVYMLVHNADYEILPNTKNIAIPESVSEAKPRQSTVMMVTRDTVFVNGTPTATVADLSNPGSPALETLRTRLAEESSRKRLLAPDDPTAREVTVMADKTLPYSVLKTILTTATAADIGKVSLAVIERERAFGGPVR
ncbi:MAG: biopolymer transporter ExbD [Steroidobacteraceae bacterium]|nr:biopolymer transporter ExbD [Steroidobacteraceae bacterium]